MNGPAGQRVGVSAVTRASDNPWAPGVEGDKPVRDIAAALPISRPAVSRHLRLLKEAGLVAEQAQGTSRIYHLREEELHAVEEYLERVWGDAARRFRLMAENTENTE